MARRPNANPAEIERQLGSPPGDLAFKATTENRTLLKSWLRAKGLASAVVDRMKLDTLGKCYRSPAYLAAIVRNQSTDSDDFADTFTTEAGVEKPWHLFRERVFLGAFETERDAWDFAERGDARSEPRTYLARNDAARIEFTRTLPPNITGLSEAEAQEIEEMTATAASATAAANDPAAMLAQAVALIAQSNRASVSREEVAAIISDEVKRAIANGPALVIEVRRDGDLIGRVEGRHHPKFSALLRAATVKDANGYAPNVWLAGPAGSGKTRAVHDVAKALACEFEHNGALAMPHELVGFIDAAGTYHATAFRRAYENGGVYLFDEVDGSDNAALLALNAALANGCARFPDAAIDRHPENRIFAAANTWGLGATADFVGRARIDAAFLDRFPVRIHWDYDEELEIAISGNPDWTRRVQAARRRAQKAGLKVAITPRASIAGAALIAAGFKPDEAADMTYLANLTREQRQQVEG